MIEIYYWLTDNGRKALQVIEETGLPHKKVAVDLTKRAQFAPDYLSIILRAEPIRRIPALSAPRARLVSRDAADARLPRR